MPPRIDTAIVQLAVPGFEFPKLFWLKQSQWFLKQTAFGSACLHTPIHIKGGRRPYRFAHRGGDRVIRLVVNERLASPELTPLAQKAAAGLAASGK